MKAVYHGNRFRMLCVLTLIKVLRGTHSYCSWAEYARTLKPGRAYTLTDDGYIVFITRDC